MLVRGAACKEVASLRLFGSPASRVSTMIRLATKYRDGRRTAMDVVDALAAMRSQNRWDEIEDLLFTCFEDVHPIPTVLWTWACRHADALTSEGMRTLLDIARTDRRLEKHAMAHDRVMAACVTGISALLERRDVDMPWTLRAAVLGVVDIMKARLANGCGGAGGGDDDRLIRLMDSIVVQLGEAASLAGAMR